MSESRDGRTGLSSRPDGWARRRFLAALAGGLLTAPLAARAQQPGKAPRIGVLQSGSRPAVAHMVDARRTGLREHGWIEGQNITLDYRYGDGQVDRLPELAAELVRLKADVVVTGAPPATVAISKATTTIPIVFWAVPLPVELGLVASLARPGGNITGLSHDVSPETNAKPLQLLKEINPRFSRIAVLRQSTNPSAALNWTALLAAGQSLGVTLQSVEVRGGEDLDGAFDAMTRTRPDALYVEPTPVTFTNRKRILDFIATNRVASAHGLREMVDGGGLFSYGPSLTDEARRAAAYIDKILKGAKPADLPVEQPTKFELVINLKTAKALGLTIPPAMLFVQMR